MRNMCADEGIVSEVSAVGLSSQDQRRRAIIA